MPKQNNEVNMLILSTIHRQKWLELIDRWEFDAINTIERISHTLDNISVTNFIGILLGTTATNLLNSWKLNYPTEYQSMIEMANNAYNVTKQDKLS